MNVWSHHLRRVVVGLVGVTAMASIALAAPASASAATHGSTSVSATTSTPVKAAPRHSNGWEW